MEPNNNTVTRTTVYLLTKIHILFNLLSLPSSVILQHLWVLLVLNNSSSLSSFQLHSEHPSCSGMLLGKSTHPPIHGFSESEIAGRDVCGRNAGHVAPGMSAPTFCTLLRTVGLCSILTQFSSRSSFHSWRCRSTRCLCFRSSLSSRPLAALRQR